MNENIETALALDLPPDAARLAAERFAARAADEGLMDVAYASVDSPVGPLLVASTRRGLVELAYDADVDHELERLSAKLSPRVLEAPAKLDPVRRELDEYFSGRRLEFDLPIDWSLTAGFTRRVLRGTAKIPYGQVSTYRQM